MSMASRSPSPAASTASTFIPITAFASSITRPARRHVRPSRRTVAPAPSRLDLQLPLYRELARPLGLEGPVELAYFNLPRRPKELKLYAAEWSQDEIDSATEKARDVIRAIRQRQFWPPGDPSQYGDEFARLCADDALNRTELIELASLHRRAAAG